MALTSQLSSDPRQLEQNGASQLGGSSGTEVALELQQINLSTKFDARVDKHEDFQSVPLGLSMPLETGEGTGTSIEIDRLAVDNQSPGSLFQSLGIDQGSYQFDTRNALGANDVSLPPLDDDVSQITYNVDVEDRTARGKSSNFELMII